MRLPFKIDRYYTTDLSKRQVIDVLDNLSNHKQFSGLSAGKFIAQTSESHFVVEQDNSGVDGTTFEQHPEIEGYYVADTPLVINIIITPNYFVILFFSIFVFTFPTVGIFVDEMTINGVFRSPTIFERLIFIVLGGVMPGLWCYFGFIRPVKKAENWIVERLMLRRMADYEG
jgi:hypothetical protein